MNNSISYPAIAVDSFEGSGPKSPGIALLLSLLICGVGQMYNGQVAKGILMLLGAVVLWIFWLGWIVWIWSMIDAYHVAKRLNLEFHRRTAARTA